VKPESKKKMRNFISLNLTLTIPKDETGVENKESKLKLWRKHHKPPEINMTSHNVRVSQAFP
jgi:hypothetical protein